MPIVPDILFPDPSQFPSIGGSLVGSDKPALGSFSPNPNGLKTTFGYPSIANNRFLIHFDGGQGQRSAVDQYGHVVNFGDSAATKILNLQGGVSPKFGSGYLQAGAGGGGVNVQNFSVDGSGNGWTAEGWVNLTGSGNALFSMTFGVMFTHNGQIQFNNGFHNATIGVPYIAGNWYHIVVMFNRLLQRWGGWFNGVFVWDQPDNDIPIANNYEPNFSGDNAGGVYFDEWRFSNQMNYIYGIGLTPPLVPFVS